MMGCASPQSASYPSPGDKGVTNAMADVERKSGGRNGTSSSHGHTDARGSAVPDPGNEPRGSEDVREVHSASAGGSNRIGGAIGSPPGNPSLENLVGRRAGGLRPCDSNSAERWPALWFLLTCPFTTEGDKQRPRKPGAVFLFITGKMIQATLQLADEGLSLSAEANGLADAFDALEKRLSLPDIPWRESKRK